MAEIYTPTPPSPVLPERAMERSYLSHQAVPLADLGCFPIGPHYDNYSAWLRESGDLVLAAAAEAWLFLWIVDVAKAEAHTRVAWPLGKWLSNRCEISLHHDTLWVIVHHNLVEISCRDWQIRSCRCFGDFVPEGAIIEDSLLVAGSSYLWVHTSLPSDIFLVDIETWKVHRHLGDRYCFFELVTGPEPLLYLTDSDESSALYRPDGTPLPGKLPTDSLIYSLAQTPHGPGLTSLDIESDVDGHRDVDNLILRHLAPDESGSYRFIDVLTRRVVEGGCHHGTYKIFVSRDHGLYYLLVHLDRRQRAKHLLAVSVSPKHGSLAVRFRAEVPYDLALAQDRQARRVVAVFTGERGLHVLPIGRERPSFDHLPGILFDRDYLMIPQLELSDMRSCDKPLGGDQCPRSYPLSQQIQRMSRVDRSRFIGHYRAAFDDDVEELTNLCHALATVRSSEKAEAAKELEREQGAIERCLREEHAEDPSAALMIADREAEAGRWHDVRRWLRVARRGDFQDFRKSHLLHLEGLVLAREGRSDEAFEVFSKAQSYGKALCRCWLDHLIRLTRPMADPPQAKEWDEGQPLLRQLLGAIRAADRFRAAGDDEAALAALDRPVFWQTGELQMAARRAEIFLAKPDGNVTDLFQKRFVLARFRELHRNRLRRVEVELPGVTWDSERIDRVDEQARVWLETVDGDQVGRKAVRAFGR